jgi:hypothetical protein
MFLLCGNIGKDHSTGLDSTIRTKLLDVRFSVERESQEPQNRFGDSFQNLAPHIQGWRVYLVELIEVAIDDCFIGEVVLLSGSYDDSLGDFFSSCSLHVSLKQLYL